MDHYFLTNGKPDLTKTTQAIAVHGFSNRSELHQLAERVRGLETKTGGGDDDAKRVVCIGWNRS